LSPALQIFNDSVDAYASWTLFLSFVSILILISGVVLLTHKKPEPSTMQRDSVIALNSISGRQIPHTTDGKSDEHEGLHPEDHGEDGEVMWDVGEASDEEDEGTTLTPRLEGLEANHGEEGVHLISSRDGDDAYTQMAPTGGRRPTRRRSTSSTLRRDNNQDDANDGDGFGAFTGA
jgi:hypothetical protein